jgi:hypothetical protein
MMEDPDKQHRSKCLNFQLVNESTSLLGSEEVLPMSRQDGFLV